MQTWPSFTFRSIPTVRRSCGQLLVASGLIFAAGSAVQAKNSFDLRYSPLELPGPPASLLSADLNGDGARDLIAVVAYIHWEQIGTFEEVEVDEVEGIVEVMTVVPALFDRRELFVFLGNPEGGFEAPLPALELDRGVHSLELGPPGLPVVALTDDGLSRLVLEPAEAEPSAPEGGTEAPSESGEAGARFELRLEPFLVAPSVLSGSAAFLPTLDLLQDLDGDGSLDLLLPVDNVHQIFLAPSLLAAAEDARTRGEPSVRAADQTLGLWEEELTGLVRHIPLPLLRDLDGDGLPELLVRERSVSWRSARIRRNLGGGRFAPARRPFGSWEEIAPGAVTILHVGDIDADGRSEVVTQRNLSDLEAGMRKSMKQAKVPPMRNQIYPLTASYEPANAPTLEFRSVGYAATEADEGYEDFPVPGGFEDLDGDGRLDLVSVTLDFSLLQAVRILATKSLSIGMDFHLYCQGSEGDFRKVSGLDLSGKFKLRLDDLRIGQLSQFKGDFDGDGRRDFVQMGRGRNVTLHLGQSECRYAGQPDLTLRLEEEPKNLALVRINDYDGDGLSDLVVLQPQKPGEPGLTPPVRIDLYQSLGPR